MLSLMEVYSMTDTTPLSPAAQAVLDAGMEYSGPAFEPLVRKMTAAVMRAIADQVVPESCFESDDVIRAALLAIAAELEADA